MARCPTAAMAAALMLALAAAPSAAHEGNPNYESTVTDPGAPKLDAAVLSGDDRLEVHNRTEQVVVITGYEGEPYARLLPDGRVQLNVRSPATYLNDDRAGDVDLPAIADPKAAPRWKTIEGNGRFQFHDHRIHWMAKTDPPEVRKDRSARQKVFDWKVPMTVGGRPAEIRGTLFWRGDGGALPTGAIIAFGAIVAGGGLLVVVVRRRRRATSDEAGEAW